MDIADMIDNENRDMIPDGLSQWYQIGGSYGGGL